ncbi:MAG: tetratricopeptide repeat protein [Flavobacteriales bacterium]|jgi:DNA-binding CsgD family transcriptional regulator/Flp pilus assembly protein TadD|nr:tetratricopeptide repeat protein [Flavobacteriales bacterium]
MIQLYFIKVIAVIALLLCYFQPKAQTNIQVDSIIALYDTIPDDNKRIIAICRNVQSMVGENMELSVLVTNKTIEIAKEKKALEGLKMSYMTLGGISYFKADYDRAIEYFYKAIDSTSSDQKLTAKDAKILGNIGVIYKKQGNLPKALSVQKRALKVFENEQDSLRISISLTNIGEIYRVQKDYEQALIAYQQSALIKQTIGHQAGLGIVYNNMGLCYSEQKDFKQAEYYLSQAYLIEKKIGNKVRITETQLDLANHYFLSNQHLKSIGIADTALIASKELGLKRNLSDLYHVLSQNYEALSQHKEALYYHQLFFEQREALLNEDINEKIAEMDVKYETAQREKEIERQHFALKTQEAELEKNKLLRNTFAIVLLLSLIIVYFLYRANRQNKQIANLMKGQNLLIEKRNVALETINNNTSIELEKLQIALEDKEKILTNIFETKQAVEMPPELLKLSKREMEVLSYLALGWSDQEISDKLFISKSTTKTHLRRIYSKLLVKSRTEAVNIAHKYDLIGSSV